MPTQTSLSWKGYTTTTTANPDGTFTAVITDPSGSSIISSTGTKDNVINTVLNEAAGLESHTTDSSLKSIYGNFQSQIQIALSDPSLSYPDAATPNPVDPVDASTPLSSNPAVVNPTSSTIIVNDLPPIETSDQTSAEIVPNTTNITDPTAETLATAPAALTSNEPVVNNIPNVQLAGSLDASVKAQSAPVSNDTTPNSSGNTSPPVGGVKATPAAAKAQWTEAQDLRAILRVPSSYLQPGDPSAGPKSILQRNGGILFPYTPTINVDNKAEYSSQNPLHSNFTQYFYKHSSVGPISVVAKFTVQNEEEGAILLAIIHLLRSLTKMRFGDDPQAGSPPPICRFDAYGDYMLYNVPVSVASWRHELPDAVDYITVGRNYKAYGHSMVPVLSTINLELNIMYSRQEMLNHNVPQWLSGALRGQGYL